MGACGIRLVGLCLRITGLDRLVGASYGVQQQVNGRVAEALVAYRREERARLAHEMPAKDITVAGIHVKRDTLWHQPVSAMA